MTLTTHAVIGAAAASLFPQAPLLAFVAGFASHFAIDAIPHWDEGNLLRSVEGDERDSLSYDMRLGKDFLIDLFILGSDALLGLVLSFVIFYFWLFHVPPLIILIGVMAGQLPDALQFVYMKLRPRFMAPLQKFHVEMQKEIANPLALLIELALMVAVVALLKFFS